MKKAMVVVIGLLFLLGTAPTIVHPTLLHNVTASVPSPTPNVIENQRVQNWHQLQGTCSDFRTVSCKLEQNPQDFGPVAFPFFGSADIIQGYNHGTHGGIPDFEYARYAFDFDLAAGDIVFAPIGGEVLHESDEGCRCWYIKIREISPDTWRYLELCHVKWESYLDVGCSLVSGEILGVIAGPGDPEYEDCPYISGGPHLHMAAYDGEDNDPFGGTRTPVPYDIDHNMEIDGISFPPAPTPTPNQYKNSGPYFSSQLPMCLPGNCNPLMSISVTSSLDDSCGGSPPSPGQITFYQDADHNPGSLNPVWRDTPGWENVPDWFNDHASSVTVADGWSVMVFDDENRGGGKKCYSADDGNFGDDQFDNGGPVNDAVSSFEVFAAPGCPPAPQPDYVTLYEHAGYGGHAFNFGPGAHKQMPRAPFDFNDQVSSIDVPTSYSAMVFRDEDWRSGESGKSQDPICARIRGVKGGFADRGKEAHPLPFFSQGVAGGRRLGAAEEIGGPLGRAEA